jgi:hypothetical protein
MIFDWHQFSNVHTYFDNSYEWAHGDGGSSILAAKANKVFMLMMQQ